MKLVRIEGLVPTWFTRRECERVFKECSHVYPTSFSFERLDHQLDFYSFMQCFSKLAALYTARLSSYLLEHEQACLCLQRAVRRRRRRRKAWERAAREHGGRTSRDFSQAEFQLIVKLQAMVRAWNGVREYKRRSARTQRSKRGAERSVNLVYAKRARGGELGRLQEAMRENFESCLHAFVFLDLEGSDRVSRSDFVQGLSRLGFQVSLEVAGRLFRMCAGREGRMTPADLLLTLTWHDVINVDEALLEAKQHVSSLPLTSTPPTSSPHPYQVSLFPLPSLHTNSPPPLSASDLHRRNASSSLG